MTSGAGVAARAASTVGLLVAIGVVNRVLGADALGLWILLVSSVALLGFADLGIGYGLLNHLAQARGRDDDLASQHVASSAFFALLALAAALALITAIVFPMIPWQAILDLPDSLATDGPAAIAVFAGCAIVSIPLAVSQRVHLAMQEGYWAHIWSTVGSVGAVIAVVVVANVSPSLPLLTLAMLGGAPVAYLLDSIVLFGWQHRDLRPRLSRARRRDATAILRTGGVFFVLSAAYAVGFEADTIVISHFLGPDAVATYSVPLRLFLLMPMFTALLVAPLWPAYGEAIERRDHRWVRATIKRSSALTLVLVVPTSIILTFVARPILAVWVPGIEPSPSLLAWLGLWAIVYAIATTLGMFLNGASVMRFQVVVASLMAVANLAASIVLVQRLGIEGPVIGSVIAEVVVVLVPMTILIWSFVRLDDGALVDSWLRRWSSADRPSTDHPSSDHPSSDRPSSDRPGVGAAAHRDEPASVDVHDPS